MPGEVSIDLSIFLMCFLQLLILCLKDTIIIHHELSNKCNTQNRQIPVFYCGLKGSFVALPKVPTKGVVNTSIWEIIIYTK